jgi:steroid delta-isomerase-like uncharacterized protein
VSKAVFIEHIEQIWNNGDARAIERFIARNYVGVDPAEPEVIRGVEGYKQHFVTLTTGFPDMRITIDDIMAEGDRVAARWHVEATHTGPFGDLPPTGRRISVTGIDIARITNYQIVIQHANSDTLGMLRQLGVILEPPKVPARLIF